MSSQNYCLQKNISLPEIRLSGRPPFNECLIIPLTNEGTITPEAKEAILPEMEDSAFSLLAPPLLQPLFNLGLPRKRLCFCWLRLTKDEHDWNPDSWPKEDGLPLLEVARVWPPSEEDLAKWLGVKWPGSLCITEALRGCKTPPTELASSEI